MIPDKRPGPRGPHAISTAARRRMLEELQRRADAGDAAAAGELVRIGLFRDALRIRGVNAMMEGAAA